ncbi:uncharacterized protein EDB91DRAFT_1259053 [Suillus paluster]|uniref:uncharacterized protein n=1 Tax=Suillus paluster TaxID=48578 RepID=UPI001B886E85|nr:uncharacterized protein EDB91DRAFT_1259053 [Suillus paluster]KAG1717951.1 hypothetical protein EDB91DRAFT_1259053 [Suillus paluster]
MKTKLAKKASDALSTQSHSSSKSISSSISNKAKSLKKAIAKGAKALTCPLKKVKQSFVSRDNDKAMAGASNPDPDSAADLEDLVVIYL